MIDDDFQDGVFAIVECVPIRIAGWVSLNPEILRPDICVPGRFRRIHPELQSKVTTVLIPVPNNVVLCVIAGMVLEPIFQNNNGFLQFHVVVDHPGHTSAQLLYGYPRLDQSTTVL